VLSVDFVVAPYNRGMVGKAMAVAAVLREAGASVDSVLEPRRKVAQAFDYANRAGADFMAFVAPDEWEAGDVCIKSLRAPLPSELISRVSKVDVIDATNEDRKQVIVPRDGLQGAARLLLSWASRDENQMTL